MTDAMPSETISTKPVSAVRAARSSMPMPAVKRSLFQRLGLGRRKGVGREPRSVCCLVAVLVLVDKALPIDGLITEIGNGSVLFRAASTYILDRTGAAVTVRFGDQDIRGTITAVSSAGYDVELSSTLSAVTVSETLAQFGLSTPAATRTDAREQAAV
jgi:hypothetical protein